MSLLMEGGALGRKTMNLSRIRKVLGAQRRALRLKLFGNNQSAVVNIANRRYHAKARKAWAQTSHKGSDASSRESAGQLERDGYVRFSPPSDQAVLDRLKTRADEAFTRPEFCTSPIDGAIRLKDGIGKLPEICQVITEDIVRAVENYFQSFFKIYWVQIYRTVPTQQPPDASFLWHLDNCPREVVKLMVYLTDTFENTGAFRLKPRPLSVELIRRGFWDRSAKEEFASMLEDDATTTVFEGPKGTRILFLNWGCVHRAKHPQAAHRDVAVFNFVPSLVPWEEHMRRHKTELSLRQDDVCPDPARY
jgi:hypothetical protein